MIIRKLLFIFLFIFLAENNFAQNQDHKKINIDKLQKVKGKFYLTDKYPIPYSGEAYDFFPNKNIRFYWKIKNGIVIQFIQYSSDRVIVNEENFNTRGIYDGKYYVGKERGDTLFFGMYKSGKRSGEWIMTNSDSSKTKRNYK